MTAAYVLNANFNRGEVGPLVHARSSVDFYGSALELCEGWDVLPEGGLRRSSGTRFIAESLGTGGASRMFSFIFSDQQAYVIELTANGQVYFFALRGYVENGGSPYTITHPYAVSELAELDWEQFNDVAYITHPNHAPRVLRRIAETNWVLDVLGFDDGPYLDMNNTTTRLTPTGRGDVREGLSPTYSGSGTDPANAFDDDPATAYTDNVRNGYVEIDLGAGNERAVDGYSLQSWQIRSIFTPSDWKIQGSNDGVNYDNLDTRQGEVFSRAQIRHFSFSNKTAYRYWRLEYSNNNTDDNNSIYIAGLWFHWSAEDQIAKPLVADSTAGINEGVGFQASDVGRPIRLFGSDASWRWARIVSYNSTTSVDVVIYGAVLPDLDSIIRWRLGAFSDESGWPACICLYKERLFFAGNAAKPVSVFGTKQGGFNAKNVTFSVNDELVATDAISISLQSSQMNRIRWLVDAGDLVAGSAGEVRAIGPADITQEFSATNVAQRKGPTTGAAGIEPTAVSSTQVYVGAGGRRLFELGRTDGGEYDSNDISILSEHLIASGVSQLCYTNLPDSIIRILVGTGGVVDFVYERNQQVVGFARRNLKGEVETMAPIPSIFEGYDDLYITVKRTVDGVEKRFVEVVERPFDPETDNVEDSVFMLSALTYDGTATTNISGLDHLAGEQVTVLSDGRPAGLFTVSEAGTITLDVAASKVTAGLPYKSKGRTLRLLGPGQDGALLGRQMNVIGVTFDLYGAGGLRAGAPGGIKDEVLSANFDQIAPDDALFTGAKPVQIEGSWASSQGQIEFETDVPLPCIIRALQMQLESTP